MARVREAVEFTQQPKEVAFKETADTVFRDYFGDGGLTGLTVLADFEGDADEKSFAYRFGNRLVRTNNDFFGAVTGIPAQFRDNWELLRDPLQRRLLARAMFDESLLTGQRRKALFSMLLWGGFALWLVAGIALAFVNREALPAYRSLFTLFFYSLATSLFLPTPFELILADAVKSIGVVWTVTVAAVAKVAGAWLVLMLGDKANRRVEGIISRWPRAQRVWERMVAFAQRYGYAVVFGLFAIPFMTDTAPLFLLSVLNMRKGLFLAVTFVAIVVRSLLFIYAGDFFASLF